MREKKCIKQVLFLSATVLEAPTPSFKQYCQPSSCSRTLPKSWRQTRIGYPTPTVRGGEQGTPWLSAFTRACRHPPVKNNPYLLECCPDLPDLQPLGYLVSVWSSESWGFPPPWVSLHQSYFFLGGVRVEVRDYLWRKKLKEWNWHLTSLVSPLAKRDMFFV